ncbi:MAG: GGDEF domain-containing protein, partial [gamma proteobacterium symbiont of Lucinoma myriamae]|nr:GGDEF domain-containing protein [gamma proteobacterium symbiont of Lucinoma myriamae]
LQPREKQFNYEKFGAGYYVVAWATAFFRINDTYGHTKGDDILKELAQLITNAFRSEDLIIRYGGEEFVIIMADSSEKNALKKADALRAKVENNYIKGIKITISVGVASTIKNSNFKTLFNQADKALYHAKENGRNQIITYPLMNTA